LAPEDSAKAPPRINTLPTVQLTKFILRDLERKGLILDPSATYINMEATSRKNQVLASEAYCSIEGKYALHAPLPK